MLFGSSSNSYIISMQSYIYIYIYIYIYTHVHNIEKLVGERNKICVNSESDVPWKSFLLSFWALEPEVRHAWPKE